jgi:predicted transposase YbfD/YdcC
VNLGIHLPSHLEAESMSKPICLLDAFALVPDPRSGHGRFHPLVAILALTAVAMLAGCNSYSAIAQFGRDRGLPLAVALGFRRAKTPNKTAIGKLFKRLDVAAFEQALQLWLQSRIDGEHAALDGKTVRGSKDGELPGKHLLSVFMTENAAVLGQLEMARTTNEHKAALKLLGVLPLTGKIITADAMFTHQDVCDTIVDGGGDYLLAVDDNQPTLKNDIEQAFTASAGFSPPIKNESNRRNNSRPTVSIKVTAESNVASSKAPPF